MLFVPEADPIYRILSIDPGTDTLGVGVIDVNLSTYRATAIFAHTFIAKKLALYYPQVEDVHGERQARLEAHTNNTLRLLMEFQPHCVISESPYMGRFPQAYAALVECFYAIRRAVMQYDRSMPVEPVDPATVKKALGVSGKSGDKELMRQGLRQVNDMDYTPDVCLDLLDEHAIDALAVGYFKYQRVLQVAGPSL